MRHMESKGRWLSQVCEDCYNKYLNRPLIVNHIEPDVDVGLKIPRVHKAEYQKRDMASIMGVPDGRVRKVKAEIRDVLRYRYRFVFTKAFTKYPLRTQRRLIETISEEFSSFGWEYWKVKEILFSMAEDAFRNLQNERRAEARIVARLRGSLPEKQPHARQNTHILQPRGQQNSTVSTVQTTYERSTHGNRQTISRQNNARNPPARPATSQPQPVSGRLSGRSLAAGQLNTRSNLDVAMGCGKATESHLGHDNLSDDEFHDEDGTEEDENMDGVDDPDLEEDENTDGVNDPNLEYNEEDVFYGDEVDVVAEAEESGEEDVGIGQSHDEYESGEEDQVGLDQGYSANEDDVMQGRQDEVVDYSTDEMGFEADEDGEYGSHEDDVLDAEYADDQSFNIMASAPNPDEDGNGLHGDYSGDELQEDLAYEKHPNAGDGYTVNDEGSQYGSDDSDERGDVARISPMRIPWKKSASARTSPVQPNKSFFPGAQVHRRLRTSPLREVPKKRARFADDVVDNEPEVERFKAYQSSRMKMDIPPKITADAPHLQPLADSLNRYRENMIRRAEAREKMWTTFRGSDGRQEQADAPLNTATYSSQNLPKPRPPSTAADKQAARAGFKFPDSIETLPTSWDPPPEITRKGRVVTTTESMRQYKQEQERARRRTMRRKVWKAHVGDRKEQNSAVAAEIRNRVRGGGVPVPSSSKWNGREMNQ